MQLFGRFSGKAEIEAVVVDDALDKIYYSDEGTEIRVYHADPKKGSDEIITFGHGDFREDMEGVAVRPWSDTSGKY